MNRSRKGAARLFQAQIKHMWLNAESEDDPSEDEGDEAGFNAREGDENTRGITDSPSLSVRHIRRLGH